MPITSGGNRIGIPAKAGRWQGWRRAQRRCDARQYQRPASLHLETRPFGRRGIRGCPWSRYAAGAARVAATRILEEVDHDRGRRHWGARTFLPSRDRWKASGEWTPCPGNWRTRTCRPCAPSGMRLDLTNMAARSAPAAWAARRSLAVMVEYRIPETDHRRVWLENQGRYAATH